MTSVLVLGAAGSIARVASLVVTLATNPTLEVRESLGVDTPV